MKYKIRGRILGGVGGLRGRPRLTFFPPSEKRKSVIDGASHCEITIVKFLSYVKIAYSALKTSLRFFPFSFSVFHFPLFFLSLQNPILQKAKVSDAIFAIICPLKFRLLFSFYVRCARPLRDSRFTDFRIN